MNDPKQTPRDFTTTITVDQTPEQVYAAINDVRAWWSGQIEGPTDQLGGEFTYRYQQLHFTKQKVTELVPGRRVVWDVVDSNIHFVEDEREWAGTRVIFDIARKGDQTEVRFTHEGLVPERECYEACSAGWTTYFSGSLRSLLATGQVIPTGPARTRRAMSLRARRRRASERALLRHRAPDR